MAKKQTGIKVITKNLPKGYEIHKWSYKDYAGKHNAHAIYFEGVQIIKKRKKQSTAKKGKKRSKKK